MTCYFCVARLREADIYTPAGWCLVQQLVVPAAGRCDTFWEDDFIVDSPCITSRKVLR